MEEYSLLFTLLRNGCIIVWCVVAAIVMMFGAVLELKTFLQGWHKDGHSKTRVLSNLFLYIGFVFLFNIFWIAAVIQGFLTWKIVTATSPKITPIDDRVELYFAAQPQIPQP